MTGLVKSDDEVGLLFVTEKGGPLTGKCISAMVIRYVARSGLGKVGSCHLFRHTCATLMLEHGADIRHVQEQSGHACLQTTQIYTHVPNRKLKEVHAATHPRGEPSGAESLRNAMRQCRKTTWLSPCEAAWRCPWSRNATAACSCNRPSPCPCAICPKVQIQAWIA